MPQVEIMSGYIPGAIGRVAELHGVYYHREWDFGLFFEAKVATELSTFLEVYDEQRDGFWVAVADGRVEGSIAVDGFKAATEGAHLHWFVVSDGFQGQGVGQRLIETAIAFCRSQGYGRVFLWTFEGLDCARHIYEKNGFRLVEQQTGARWGRAVSEQRFELQLA